MPVSGGASTAACTYYDETLKEYGLRILSALQWHGVAMVEFKRQQSPDRLVLMEINPKFWGSVELALEAGVDFASDLVRVFRGETSAYSEATIANCISTGPWTATSFICSAPGNRARCVSISPPMPAPTWAIRTPPTPSRRSAPVCQLVYA